MATVHYPETEFGDLHRRLFILRVGLLLVVALLGLRLWHLQIREGPYYRDLSENNRTRLVLLEPARGLIYDRHGVLLANNVPSFSLYVTLEDVKDREALILQLTDLLGLDPALVRKKMTAKGSKLLPRKIKDRMTLRDATLVESNRLDMPGVMIQVESQRNYPGGVTAAHLLGYVGEISADQLEKPESIDLHQGSIVGQYGVEKSYDRHMRGMAGQKNVEVDALGHEKKVVVVERPQAGNDLYLTIDVRLQKVAEELLGQEYGAIVALDPSSGDILAMASRPGFDPNVLSRELTAKQWV
ncbi:MAG: penicillin-binding protein 2, partial [Nitrospirota bacterium]